MPRIFLYLVPVLVLGLLFAFFLKEKPLVSENAPVPEARNAQSGQADVPSGTAREHPRSPHARCASRPDGPPPLGSPAGTVRPPYSLRRRSPAASQVPHRSAASPSAGACTTTTAAAYPARRSPSSTSSGKQIGRGASGEDGRYALSTPGAGSYVLIAAAGGHQPQAVSVTVGERPVELDVVLGGAGRLAGRVLTADGLPVRDAAVTLTDVRGEVVATTRSGREGGYVITELVAGEYTLAASAPAFRPAALPVTVQAARETRQDIELAGGAVLRGTVRAGGGRPVEDARVTLLDAAGNVVDTAHHRHRRHLPLRRPVLRRVHGHRLGLSAGRHRAPSGGRRPY